MLKSLFLTCFLLASTSLLLAQEAQDYYNQLIEIIAENLETGEEFDYSELAEHIDDWQRKPININAEETSVLAQWSIISDYAYQQLQDHIRRNGPLLSILELQSIPGFDPATIRILESITNVAGRDMFTQTASLGRLLLHGQNEIYIRGGRTIEKADGYIGDPPDYEGSPDKIYMRLRHRNSNVLSYGITGEKDAGEAFFKGSNKSGFDFYSAHLSLQNYRSWLPAVMLGDFVASFGQGLIMHSGFGSGKSSFVTSIKKTGNPLRPYTSVDENNFLRGIGVTVKPMDNLTVTLFGSKNNRDGNLEIDTIREGGEITDIQADITSLQTANLHRTKSEIADENAIDLTQAGLNVSYQSRRTHLGFNALHSSLSSPLNRTPDLYNQYYFNGDKLTNASVDYGFWLSGIHFFGETAVSDNGGLATVNGVLAGLDRHILAAILFRSFARDYQSLTPNVFAESSSASNEMGLYTGLEITPSVKWKLQLYHDIWSNPWLRFRVDRPAGGEEIFARLTYTIKRRLEIYAQFRTKKSSIDFTQEGSSIPDVTDQRRSQARLNINNMLDKTIQLRTRLEWSFYTFNSDHENGFLVYQDFLYKPVSSPWSLSGRVVLFDTDSFNTRIYTYENDLIYYYAIPAFSDKGSRYYINLRYKGIRHLTAEIKYARTQWLDMTTVGSGNDEIQGNRRSEIRGQLIYRFEN
ncbi:MAG: helix-hairpin-helix domain-containing protein [Saprospiraceae bacterium]